MALTYPVRALFFSDPYELRFDVALFQCQLLHEIGSRTLCILGLGFSLPCLPSLGTRLRHTSEHGFEKILEGCEKTVNQLDGFLVGISRRI